MSFRVEKAYLPEPNLAKFWRKITHIQNCSMPETAET
jgi:hypothetical protein